MTLEIILYLFIFLYGITIGSFLNVCIYRIPKDETVVTEGSHCMSCNHKLAWYDLFPLFSWILLKGKCRYCGEKISAQYPLIELINGVAYCGIIALGGFNADSIMLCLVFSTLLVIAVIDYRTMLIPTAANLIILAIGVVHLFFHLDNWQYYVIGLFFSGGFLFAIAMLFRGITGKSGLGLGDIELMACAGLFCGWGHGLFAIIIGSVSGAIIEGVRIAITHEKGKFPFGPYLAAGLMISLLWGVDILEWYQTTIL
ncbi:MAG: prepilin peptidase [Eubacterium sp.]|nr:prepilin peptidase [Eubacterium sp.]